jgi:polyhydroxyalkanoate synthesis regulator phasin
MNQDIKKGLVDLGIGVASYVIIESLTNTVHKMEKEGKLNKKEGERMVREAVSKYEAGSAKYTKVAMEQLDNLIKASPFATKKDIEELHARLDRLNKSSQKAAGRLSKQAKKAGRRVSRKGGK